MNLFKGSLLFCVSLVCAEEVIVDAPKIITKEWEERVFGIKQDARELPRAVHEMIDGILDDTFEKDFFERIDTAVKKQPKGEGVYTEYWPNGTLKAKLPFKDGRANGHVHGWYDNERDAFKGHFKDGIKQGIHITFFRTEPRHHTKEARILRYNLKGQLHGKQECFYKSGRLRIFFPYDNGMPNGALGCLDSQEKKYIYASYKNGYLEKKPPPPPEKRREAKGTPAPKYVREVTNTFIKIAKKEFGLRCGATGGAMPFDVESICVFLNTNQKGTIEEGRELFVKLKEKFVEVINNHEKLRPFLREYPFTPARAEILLSFCDEKGMTLRMVL